ASNPAHDWLKKLKGRRRRGSSRSASCPVRLGQVLLAAGPLHYLRHQSTGHGGVARPLASTSTQPPARRRGQRREHERRRKILRGHPDATQVVGPTRG